MKSNSIVKATHASFLQNYEPCYVKDKKSDGISATAASGSYEIVNGSNYNAVTWTGGKDSVYLFTAVVLDPTYRYVLALAILIIIFSTRSNPPPI